MRNKRFGRTFERNIWKIQFNNAFQLQIAIEIAIDFNHSVFGRQHWETTLEANMGNRQVCHLIYPLFESQLQNKKDLKVFKKRTRLKLTYLVLSFV